MFDKMIFVTLGVNLFLAAFLQDTLPVCSWLPVKIPLLLSVMLFVALERPLRIALLTALVAGGVADALGNVPMPCTTFFFLALTGIARFMQRMIPMPGWIRGALLTGCGAVLGEIWLMIWLGSANPLPVRQQLVRTLYFLPVGVIAGGVVFVWCGLLDRLSGLVKPAEEGNGVLWSETDR